MHIEPGLVADNKIWLSYVTAAGACGYTLKSAYQAARQRGLDSTLTRSAVVTGLVLSFFEVLPHYPVGVSEVHLIFGSTLFLVFGAAPAGIGLAFIGTCLGVLRSQRVHHLLRDWIAGAIRNLLQG